jgi:hypothetical protein
VALWVTTDRVYVAMTGSRDGGGSDRIAVLAADPQYELLAVWALGTGNGERVSWSLQTAVAAQALLDSTTATWVAITAQEAGPVVLRVSYVWPNNNAPYTFRVRLNEAIATKDPKQFYIRKDQYDLVMNILNALHPVGVEVDTRIIRERVRELQAGGLLELFPAHTFPDFRARGPRPVDFNIGQDSTA